MPRAVRALGLRLAPAVYLQCALVDGAVELGYVNLAVINLNPDDSSNGMSGKSFLDIAGSFHMTFEDLADNPREAVEGKTFHTMAESIKDPDEVLTFTDPTLPLSF